MKIRNYYVSNSSRSSFIIRDDPALEKVSSGDLRRMFREIYPSFDAECLARAEILRQNNMNPEKYPIGCVFDMKDKGDRDEAEKTLGDLLDGWVCNETVVAPDGSLLGAPERGSDHAARPGLAKYPARNWREVCSGVSARAKALLGYELSYSMLPLQYIEKHREKGLSCYDPRKKTPSERYKVAPIPENLMEILRKKWKKLGLCTNGEIMRRPEARFVFHFEDNDVWDVFGAIDGGPGWETGDWSYNRICEVMARYLVKNKLVPETFTWKDLMRLTLACNMHEG